MVQLLSSTSMAVQMPAAEALWRLVREIPGSSGEVIASNRAAIAAEPGCIMGLAKLLGSARLGLQLAAARALSELALDIAGNQAIAAEPVCVTALVKLRGSDNSAVQAAAEATLHSLALRTGWGFAAVELPLS